MKANEAPEKIYMPNELLSEEWQRHIEGEDTEYTRTDAFIEKACEWLEANRDHSLIGCEDPCLSGYLTSAFIEDFRKAMEGE